MQTYPDIFDAAEPMTKAQVMALYPSAAEPFEKMAMKLRGAVLARLRARFGLDDKFGVMAQLNYYSEFEHFMEAQHYIIWDPSVKRWMVLI